MAYLSCFEKKSFSILTFRGSTKFMCLNRDKKKGKNIYAQVKDHSKIHIGNNISFVLWLEHQSPEDCL